MASLSFYDTTTGAVTRVFDVPDDEASFYVDLYGAHIEEILDPAAQYVDVSKTPPEPAIFPSFVPVADKTSIKADGTETIQISGFPAGASISVVGPAFDAWEETSVSFEMTVNMPGDYCVTIRKWPYITQEVKFNAT